MKDDILFDRSGGLGLVLLNRPKALNALTLEMVDAFDRQLLAWADDAAVRAVVAEGAGERAFAAGGDIQGSAKRAGRATPIPARSSGTNISSTGGSSTTRSLCRADRRHRDGRRRRRSVLGSHRVATERTVFAMPETGIGFFPDVGANGSLPACRAGSGSISRSRAPGSAGLTAIMPASRPTMCRARGWRT